MPSGDYLDCVQRIGGGNGFVVTGIYVLYKRPKGVELGLKLGLRWWGWWWFFGVNFDPDLNQAIITSSIL